MSDEKVFAIVLFLLTGNQNKDRDDLTNIINKSGATRGHVLFISYKDDPKSDISENDRNELLKLVNPPNLSSDSLPYTHSSLNIQKEKLSENLEINVLELVEKYEADNYICRVYGSELLIDGRAEKRIFKRIEARQRIRKELPRPLKNNLECFILLAMGEICSSVPKTPQSEEMNKESDNDNKQLSDNNGAVIPKYLSKYLEYNAKEKRMYANLRIIMSYPPVFLNLWDKHPDTSCNADDKERDNFWGACSHVYSEWGFEKDKKDKKYHHSIEPDYAYIAVRENTRPHVLLCKRIISDFCGDKARNNKTPSDFSKNPLVRSNGKKTTAIKYTLTDYGLSVVSDIRDADLSLQIPAYKKRNRGQSESLSPKSVSQSDEQILEANLQLVRQLYDDGNYADALNICSRIYEDVRYSPPRNIAMLHIEKCKCLIELGQIREARTSLDQAYILGGYDDAIQAIIADIKSKYQLGEDNVSVRFYLS